MARNNRGTSSTDESQRGTSKRGFAKMKLENPKRLREIASKGGQEAHERGTAHQFTSEEARAAALSRGRNTASTPQ